MRGFDKGYDHWKTTEPPEFCEFPPDADGEESEMDRVCRHLREARTMLADADKLIVACCQKHGARMTVPVMCDACDERPATETHDFDGFAPPIHLCEPCADRWRDRWLERGV